MTDIELISKVKKDNDSTALNELIHRHSGVYVKIIQKYANIEKNSAYSSNKLDINELRDDKAYNIYNYVLSFSPDKKMKFGTYVGAMTRYLCLDILNDTPEKVEITEFNSPATEENIREKTSEENSLDEIKKRAKEIKDSRFWPIFEMRDLNDKRGSWRDIGTRLNISHERTRQIYNKNIKYIKSFLKT